MGAEQAFPRPVTRTVDLARYAGTWFEFARVDSVFEPPGTRDVRATYSIGPGGRFDILNQAIAADGRLLEWSAYVCASFNEHNSDFAICSADGQRRGRYRILELDDNYQWAAVGGDMNTVWILSRSTAPLPEALLDALTNKLVLKHGYDVREMGVTQHCAVPPPFAGIRKRAEVTRSTNSVVYV